jgi:hypothetical protein
VDARQDHSGAWLFRVLFEIRRAQLEGAIEIAARQRPLGLVKSCVCRDSFRLRVNVQGAGKEQTCNRGGPERSTT